LAKQKGFLKLKSCNVTTWAFYVINNASTTISKVSSSHHELKHLKCVFCYLIVVAHVGLIKGGIINYKFVNKISAL
jgi:hypothetical protein